jgi:hypothetical protein
MVIVCTHFKHQVSLLSLLVQEQLRWLYFLVEVQEKGMATAEVAVAEVATKNIQSLV